LPWSSTCSIQCFCQLLKFGFWEIVADITLHLPVTTPWKPISHIVFSKGGYPIHHCQVHTVPTTSCQQLEKFKPMCKFLNVNNVTIPETGRNVLSNSLLPKCEKTRKKKWKLQTLDTGKPSHSYTNKNYVNCKYPFAISN